MTKAQGRRSKKLAGYYSQHYIRTARNKMRRLAKRVDFDKTALPRMNVLKTVTAPK